MGALLLAGNRELDQIRGDLKMAQARLDSADAEVRDLERQVAQLQQSQRDKISIPNGAGSLLSRPAPP